MSHGDNRLLQAYDRMMERVRQRLEILDEAGQKAVYKLQHDIEHAVEEAVELDELTREEAHQIGAYLKRDLEDAGHYLATTERELADWFRFDVHLVEERLLEWFSRAADKSRLEMMTLEEQLERANHYQSGEITGPGTLQCENCGKLLHFHATQQIPPCSECHSTQFTRSL